MALAPFISALPEHQTRSCHSSPSGNSSELNSRCITRRCSGLEHAEEACSNKGRSRIAAPFGTMHATLGYSLQAAICSSDALPFLCEPGMTRSGPLSSLLSSRCRRMANILAITCAGGCTWGTPAFMVHGPYPGTSRRSRTAIVRSWCHCTFQFDSGVLSNKMPLTAKQPGPERR